MNFNSNICLNLFKYKRKIATKWNIFAYRRRNFMVSSKLNDRVPNILFFGTDSFSLPSLRALNNLKCDLGTVTSFKSPANCIRQYAEINRIPIHRWPISAEICRQYELGVVVSFGHLISSEIIKSLPLGIINVHASLLPRWRGAAPIIYSIMNGDKETGVSIMKIEPKHFDIGDILAQRSVVIKENCLMPELHEILAKLGAQLLLEVVNDFSTKLKNAKKQETSLVSYAPKVTSALTEIRWSELEANQIYRRFRALYGFKYLSTKFQGKNIHLIDVQLPAFDFAKTDLLENYKTPGSFLYLKERKCLLVRCAKSTFIEIRQLRIEGKKIMSSEDFNNGFLKKIKTADVCFVQNKNIVRY